MKVLPILTFMLIIVSSASAQEVDAVVPGRFTPAKHQIGFGFMILGEPQTMSSGALPTFVYKRSGAKFNFKGQLGGFYANDSRSGNQYEIERSANYTSIRIGAYYHKTFWRLTPSLGLDAVYAHFNTDQRYHHDYEIWTERISKGGVSPTVGLDIRLLNTLSVHFDARYDMVYRSLESYSDYIRYPVQGPTVDRIVLSERSKGWTATFLPIQSVTVLLHF